MVGQEKRQQHPRDLSSCTLGRPYARQQITRELLPYLPTDPDQTLVSNIPDIDKYSTNHRQIMYHSTFWLSMDNLWYIMLKEMIMPGENAICFPMFYRDEDPHLHRKRIMGCLWYPQ